MARKKDTNPKHHPAALKQPPPQPSRAARLGFPVAVAVSLAAEWVLRLAFAYAGAPVGEVRRAMEGWKGIGVMAGWRAAEVGVAWAAGWGVQDVALLALLMQFPTGFLLAVFYRTRPLAVLASTATSFLSLTLPFTLFCPISSPVKALGALITTTNLPVTLLAASVYAVTAYASFLTYAPTHLVAHFNGIPDISFTHTAHFPGLVCLLLPVGVLSGWFVYNPATAAAPRPSAKVAGFNPAIETVWQRLCRKCWTQLTPRTKEIVRRTVTIMVVGGGDTVLRTWAMIEGVDGVGAAGYAGAWKLGAAMTGMMYWWVGSV